MKRIASKIADTFNRCSADVWTAAVLFAVGAAAAMVYNATWGGVPLFWQNTTFMQGIMWSCGHGFENPMVSDIPGLEPFLDSRTDCFDCAAIPENVRVLPHDTRGMSFEEIDAYHPQDQFPGFLAWQRYHFYLVWAVTLCWWAMGSVCWSALTPLCGLLYGAAVAAAYGLFRLGMRRPLALLCAMLFLVSPLHLQMVPHIRDYAKAPFILSALLIMGCLIKYPMRARWVLLLSAACGALTGIGVGFRTDLAICVPAFIVVALVFLPGPLRSTALWRVLAATVFMAAFILAGYPVLVEVFKESGHFAHVTLLGFLKYCDDRLGVGAPLYHLGDPYTDFYLANVVQSYMHRIHGVMPPTHVMMPEYHEATQRFLSEYLKVFPADIVLRAYASVLRVLDEMHPHLYHPWPAGITNQFLCRLYEARAALLDHLPGGGRYYAGAALILLASRNLRWAFAALFLLLYFAGYPAMQFNLRHAFHLEFLSLWATAFLLQAVWIAARRRNTHEDFSAKPVRRYRGVLARVVIFLVGAAAIIVTPLAVLRPYQHEQLGRLIDGVTHATLQQLPVLRDPAPPSDVLFRLPGFAAVETLPPDDAQWPTHYEYLAVELENRETDVPVTFVYNAEDREHFDYTRTVIVPANPATAGPTRLYFPLYYSREARFVGVSVPAALQDRVKGFYRVAGAEKTPLWLTLILPTDGTSQVRHQTFTR